MSKYSAGRDGAVHEHAHLDAEIQYSMKLFRAQRNFYIAGFALFLCLVIRRLVLLIQTQAGLLAERDAAIKQAKGASDAAQSMLKSSSSTTSGDEINEELVKKLRKEMTETKEDLKKMAKSEESLKKQAENLTKEYDRLMKEHETVQRKYDALMSASDTRKDK